MRDDTVWSFEIRPYPSIEIQELLECLHECEKVDDKRYPIRESPREWKNDPGIELYLEGWTLTFWLNKIANEDVPKMMRALAPYGVEVVDVLCDTTWRPTWEYTPKRNDPNTSLLYRFTMDRDKSMGDGIEGWEAVWDRWKVDNKAPYINEYNEIIVPGEDD